MSGFDWRRDEVRDAENTPEQCTMFKGSWFGPDFRCENPSEVMLCGACVHEHVWELPNCRECADDMLGGADYYCNQCSDSDKPHECRVDVEERPLAVSS